MSRFTLLSVMLAFADDMMTLSRYFYAAYEMVKYIADWSSPHGIEINYKQCVYPSPGGESVTILRNVILGEDQVESHDKYLGVYIIYY